MQIAPYLFFDGSCEEALGFYAHVFGGAVSSLMRVGDSPMAAQCPPDQHARVMHATFEAPGLTFMAADGGDNGRGEARRVALSIALEDADAGKRIFEELAGGGVVSQPYEKQFWGATFGMLVDRYGIEWMVNAG